VGVERERGKERERKREREREREREKNAEIGRMRSEECHSATKI